MKSTYAQRNKLLVKLGYLSYKDYLTSQLWTDIRTNVLKRDKYKCKLCGVKAFIIHHLDYKKDTLLGNSLYTLVTICQNCHTRVEFNKKGEKRTFSETRATYNRLRRASQSVIRYQNRAKKPPRNR